MFLKAVENRVIILTNVCNVILCTIFPYYIVKIGHAVTLQWYTLLGTFLFEFFLFKPDFIFFQF